MYVSMNELLQKANKGNYGVLAINCFNLETARAVILAAEERNSPIIINLLQEHLQHHINFNYLINPIMQMCLNASVEIAINLDHGQDISYVKKCIKSGFSGVMMDASMENLEKNISITKEIMRFSQAFDIGVEAEVGNMGAVSGDHFTDEQMYTNVDEAIHFIKETNVNCLAISYGSSHGEYPVGYIPKFNLDIVKDIKKATGIPLVLHGGSGAGESIIKQSVAYGINKINVGTDFMRAQKNYMKEIMNSNPEIDYPSLIHNSIEYGKKEVIKYINTVGSKNKSK